MTLALCFNCGHTKFGAICACEACGAGSTGNMGLDILFSDHHMSVATLGAFGRVVRAIREVCSDDELRFWSFIRFVCVHHPDLLDVNMPPGQRFECDAVLGLADPAPVEVQESGMGRFLREHEEHGDDPEAEPDDLSDPSSP